MREFGITLFMFKRNMLFTLSRLTMPLFSFPLQVKNIGYCKLIVKHLIMTSPIRQL